jgi:XTP/dITP diphosphohydrolase
MRSPPEPLLLATRSHDKAREIRQILQRSRSIELITLDEARLDPEPEEDDVEVYDTFLDNALAKAAYFARRSGMSVIADDSGICVAALGGAPGVRSRRFAADAPAVTRNTIANSEPDHCADDTDGANNSLLLARLADVAAPDRAAHYACAAAIHMRDGRRIAAIGICSGTILTECRGSLGFGYDPLFLDPLTGRSFAELDPAEKNRRSHRARAFRALAALAF